MLVAPCPSPEAGLSATHTASWEGLHGQMLLVRTFKALGPNTADMVNTVPQTAEKLRMHDLATGLSLTRRYITTFNRPSSVVLYTDTQIDCDLFFVGCLPASRRTHNNRRAQGVRSFFRRDTLPPPRPPAVLGDDHRGQRWWARRKTPGQETGTEEWREVMVS